MPQDLSIVEPLLKEFRQKLETTTKINWPSATRNQTNNEYIIASQKNFLFILALAKQPNSLDKKNLLATVIKWIDPKMSAHESTKLDHQLSSHLAKFFETDLLMQRQYKLLPTVHEILQAMMPQIEALIAQLIASAEMAKADALMQMQCQEARVDSLTEPQQLTLIRLWALLEEPFGMSEGKQSSASNNALYKCIRMLIVMWLYLDEKKQENKAEGDVFEKVKSLLKLDNKSQNKYRILKLLRNHEVIYKDVANKGRDRLSEKAKQEIEKYPTIVSELYTLFDALETTLLKRSLEGESTDNAPPPPPKKPNTNTTPIFFTDHDATPQASAGEPPPSRCRYPMT